jgi:hypothetical protein
MALTKYEQETIIGYNNEEKIASVFTYDKSLIRKIDARLSDYPDIKVARRGDGWAEYTLPKKWVTVRFPRLLSEEQREALADRMRGMRR